jgi:hypothetical protein
MHKYMDIRELIRNTNILYNNSSMLQVIIYAILVALSSN